MNIVSGEEAFLARLLREEGMDPTRYDMSGLMASLTSVCPENELTNLADVDPELVSHTIEQFEKV